MLFFCKVGRREIRRFCTEVNKQVNNIADFLGRIQRQEAQEKGCYLWQRSPPKRGREPLSPTNSASASAGMRSTSRSSAEPPGRCPKDFPPPRRQRPPNGQQRPGRGRRGPRMRKTYYAPSKLGIEKCPASGRTLLPLYVIHGFPFVLRMEPINQRQSPFMRTPCETL